MNIEEKISTLMRECAEATSATLKDDIDRDTVLLESGLDSLGFAVLIARLEEEFDIDPFTSNDKVIYPQTLGEFIDIYAEAMSARMG